MCAHCAQLLFGASGERRGANFGHDARSTFSHSSQSCRVTPPSLLSFTPSNSHPVRQSLDSFLASLPFDASPLAHTLDVLDNCDTVVLIARDTHILSLSPQTERTDRPAASLIMRSLFLLPAFALQALTVSLDINSQDSIKSAAKTIATQMLTYYNGGTPGQIITGVPGRESCSDAWHNIDLD